MELNIFGRQKIFYEKKINFNIALNELHKDKYLNATDKALILFEVFKSINWQALDLGLNDTLPIISLISIYLDDITNRELLNVENYILDVIEKYAIPFPTKYPNIFITDIKDLLFKFDKLNRKYKIKIIKHLFDSTFKEINLKCIYFISRCFFYEKNIYDFHDKDFYQINKMK